MTQRILTAVIGIPLIIGIVWLGGWWLTAAVIIISLIALTEYANAVNRGKGPRFNLILTGVLSAFLVTLVKLDLRAVPFGIVLVFMVVMAFEVLSPKASFKRATQTIFFLIYVPFLLSFLTLFENSVDGRYMVWMCFIAPFATDTFAYFGGITFKGKKLTKISPNKTISGSICGFLACAILMLGYGWALNAYFGVPIPIYYYGVLGAIASIAGQIGDISASLIKRTYHVKDFGKVLPGHGGILDRFDSVIFTAPIVYMFSYYFLG